MAVISAMQAQWMLEDISEIVAFLKSDTGPDMKYEAIKAKTMAENLQKRMIRSFVASPVEVEQIKEAV